jgi:hypothetical protein
MATTKENKKSASQRGEIDDSFPYDKGPPTVRTVKIRRDKEEGELAFVEIEVKTSLTTTTFDMTVDVKMNGTMGAAEQAAYRKLVKHLEEAKELAQSLIARP